MKTLYSYLMRDIPDEEFFGHKLSEAQIIEVSNILHYVEDQPDQEWQNEDFCLTPQYKNMFLDMTSRHETGGIKGFKAGFWITVHDPESEAFAQSLDILDDRILNKSAVKWIFLVKEYVKYPDTKPFEGITSDMIYARPKRELQQLLSLATDPDQKKGLERAINDKRGMLYEKTRIIHPMLYAIIGVNEYGQIINDKDQSIAMAVTDPLYALPSYHDQQEIWGRGLTNMIPTPLYAISLMACKNTGVYHKDLSKREQRENKKPKKRVKNYPYHIIYIKDSFTESDEVATKRIGDFTGRNIRIRRGHFRTYTPEAPLFGRIGDERFSGTFWIAPKEDGQKTHIVKKV